MPVSYASQVRKNLSLQIIFIFDRNEENYKKKLFQSLVEGHSPECIFNILIKEPFVQLLNF